MREAPSNCDVLLDATNTDYIDPDILQAIRQYKRNADQGIGPRVSLRGFRDKYQLSDEIQFVDYTTKDVQDKLTPAQALKLLQQGNQRFLNNQRLSRDLGRQMLATSTGQHPFAAVLSCIDSRAPVETILDCGLGDVFSARVAGNVTSPKVLGSLEYATAVVGAKLILVLGHTKCGAVNAAVQLTDAGQPIQQATGCQHLESVLEEIRHSIDLPKYRQIKNRSAEECSQFIEKVGELNVVHSVRKIVDHSSTIGQLVNQGKLAVVGAVYNVHSGHVDFLVSQAIGLGLESDDTPEATSPTLMAQNS
jgi:carbonic anhydrase/SulP family sulfate permease